MVHWAPAVRVVARATRAQLAADPLVVVAHRVPGHAGSLRGASMECAPGLAGCYCPCVAVDIAFARACATAFAVVCARVFARMWARVCVMLLRLALLVFQLPRALAVIAQHADRVIVLELVLRVCPGLLRLGLLLLLSFRMFRYR